MELIRKIGYIIFPFLIISCTTVIPAKLIEVKPIPKEMIAEKKVEYEPVYAIMKILEVSEENGIQKYLLAKMDSDIKEISEDIYGDIAAEISFEQVLGTFKIIKKQGKFLHCSIENLTRKIPANSFIRIQIGQKVKEE